jgi:NAD(P)H-hydrate epimerase
MGMRENSPALWLEYWPKTSQNSHKYDRGVAVILGAPKMTGATRLAAAACARMGAGLVKVVAPAGTQDIYRATLPAHIIVIEQDEAALILEDVRVTAVLAGSGCPESQDLADLCRLACEKPHIKAIVADAGAIGAAVSAQFACKNKLVLTPHEGEFKKAFPDFSGIDKMDAAKRAAESFGGVVVLKGAQTVIAGQGVAIRQSMDVPALSTAGTGDVLAGMITGLMAQGMNTPMACAAAAWIHATAGARFGRGLVAEDLPGLIPDILKDIF